jgi:AcrR family transcriptional regulator
VPPGTDATPRRPDPTAERILEAARATFARSGFDGATTRAIAREAGVNVATLAYHFGGKEGLYTAAIERMYAELLALPLPELHGTPRDRVSAVARLAWRFAQEHRVDIRLLARHRLEHDRLPEPVRERWTPALVAGALRVVAALGLPPHRDPRLALWTLNHLLARYALADEEELAQIGASQHDLEDHLVDVAVRLLLSPPPDAGGVATE